MRYKITMLAAAFFLLSSDEQRLLKVV